MKILAILLLSILPLSAVTPEQLRVLQTVRDVARTIPDPSGETYENTLSAICLTESSGGVNKIGDYRQQRSIQKSSLGVLQIRIATARYMARQVKSLRWIDTLTDMQIANKLMTDVRLSTRIAANYLLTLKQQYGKYMNMVSGYNGGKVNHPYYGRVMKNMKLVEQLVQSGALR